MQKKIQKSQQSRVNNHGSKKLAKASLKHLQLLLCIYDR